MQVHDYWGNSVGIAITGGEPLLHPDFNKIVDILDKNKFHWSLATNGLLCTPEIIDTIINKGCNTITISLDGNEKTHEIQRNHKGTYNRTLESIDLLLEKAFPNIYITATIHDDNIQSLEDIYSLISKYKESVKWRINPLLYCENVKNNNLSISEISSTKICEFADRVRDNLKINIIVGERNSLSLKYKEYMYSEFDSCFAGISTFGVLANGDIVNCMVCRDNVLGNINTCNSLKETWEEEDRTKKGLCERHLESKNSLYTQSIHRNL